MTKDSFPSILRRSLCIEFRSKFVDSNVIERMQAAGKDPEALGYFPRDPSLKEFLKSPLAILVAFRILFGFIAHHTEDSLRNIIESYVERGGDEGLTVATMRQSCGLPPQEQPTDQPEPAPAQDMPSSQEIAQRENMPIAEQVRRQGVKALVPVSVSLVKMVLGGWSDYINESSVPRLTRTAWG